MTVEYILIQRDVNCEYCGDDCPHQIPFNEIWHECTLYLETLVAVSDHSTNCKRCEECLATESAEAKDLKIAKLKRELHNFKNEAYADRHGLDGAVLNATAYNP